MTKLTPEEFYAQNPLRELDKHGKRMYAFTYYDMLDFAEAYADHLEQSSWVTDGSLPPKIEGSYISEEVAIETSVGRKYVAYYHFENETWFDMDGCNAVPYQVVRWLKLPKQ